MITRIISGGQTGADQAGLVAGVTLSIPTGGWAPHGWRTDDGPAPWLRDFGLCETRSNGYQDRTMRNVFAADGTVIFGNIHSPGCRLTIGTCVRHLRAYETNPTSERLRRRIEQDGWHTLNVAGNRERTNPGIFLRTVEILIAALA